MERLDSEIGADKWQDRYEVHNGKTICYLSIKIGDEWITKADGAGDTQVEAEKGSISDAFKRAAVKWGVGRYLYELTAPWVPCESYEKSGKHYFSKFTEDPWSYVQKPSPMAQQKKIWERLKEESSNELIDAKSLNDCREIYNTYQDELKKHNMFVKDWKDVLTAHFQPFIDEFQKSQQTETPKEAAE
jgi:hypothetical protein